MSTLYGRVTGNGKGATRTGSIESGIRATVQTWEGALTLTLDSDGEWAMYRHRAEAGGHHAMSGDPIVSGSLERGVEHTSLHAELAEFADTIRDPEAHGLSAADQCAIVYEILGRHGMEVG